MNIRVLINLFFFLIDAQVGQLSSPVFASGPAAAGPAVLTGDTATKPDEGTWPASWVRQWIDPTNLLKVMTILTAILLLMNVYLIYSNWSQSNDDVSGDLSAFGNRQPTTIDEWKRFYKISQVIITLILSLS